MPAWSFCGTFALFVPAGVLQQRINCGLRPAKPSKGTWLRSSSLSSLTVSQSEQAPLLQASLHLAYITRSVQVDHNYAPAQVHLQGKPVLQCSVCLCTLLSPAQTGSAWLLAGSTRDKLSKQAGVQVRVGLCFALVSTRTSQAAPHSAQVRRFCFRFDSKAGGEQCQAALQVML